MNKIQSLANEFALQILCSDKKIEDCDRQSAQGSPECVEDRGCRE